MQTNNPRHPCSRINCILHRIRHPISEGSNCTPSTPQQSSIRINCRRSSSQHLSRQDQLQTVYSQTPRHRNQLYLGRISCRPSTPQHPSSLESVVDQVLLNTLTCQDQLQTKYSPVPQQIRISCRPNTSPYPNLSESIVDQVLPNTLAHQNQLQIRYSSVP